MAIAYAEWGETLAGLTRAQIQHGIAIDGRRCSEWPPSSTRFRAMCMDIPSFAALRYEFAHGEVPRTPFGLLCWSKVDAYRLRRADQTEADRLVHNAYDLAVAHVLEGGTLPVVHEALACAGPPERRPAPPEVAKRHIDAMLDSLNAQEAAAEPAP